MEANRVAPGRMAVVFDDVDAMPTELVDVVNNLALEVVGTNVLRVTGHIPSHL